MQAGLHGWHGQAEDLGGVLGGQLFNIAQQEDRSQPIGQLLHAPLDVLAQLLGLDLLVGLA
jgi:hypothetical protein